MLDDTIAAIATPLGEGGIGIVRISGPDALPLAHRIFNPKNPERFQKQVSHAFYVGEIMDPESGEELDVVLLALMRAPRSYTGEDVVEVHCHGGITAVSLVLKLVLRQGARLAEPGEFTKRAFLNGRLDLSQAEAVLDVVYARTEASLRSAVRHLKGAVAEEINALREELLHFLARTEAGLDFPEEEDVFDLDRSQMLAKIDELLRRLEKLLQESQWGRVLREGISTVIIGKPNVGKSSLLNALLQQERAIVTDVPGTTRDAIEEVVNLKGVPLRIIDTAGIHETEDKVEKMGVELSLAKSREADLVLFLLDALSGITGEDRKIIKGLEGRKAIVVVNKIDVAAGRVDLKELERLAGGQVVLEISATEAIGLERLKDAIVDMVMEGKVRAEQLQKAVLNRTRHIRAVEKARDHLSEAKAVLQNNMTLDLAALDLRLAWESLGEITGEVVQEEVLDKIFEEFCIGK